MIEPCDGGLAGDVGLLHQGPEPLQADVLPRLAASPQTTTRAMVKPFRGRCTSHG